MNKLPKRAISRNINTATRKVGYDPDEIQTRKDLEKEDLNTENSLE